MVDEQKQNQDNFKHVNSWVPSFHGMIMPLFPKLLKKVAVVCLRVILEYFIVDIKNKF